MKIYLILFAGLCFSGNLFAQGTFSNKVNSVLEKVILDHAHKYKDIKGDIISQNAQTAEYKSTLFIPGASSCVVKHYKISETDLYSWGCTFVQSEDFNQAQNKFKEIYGQLNNSIVKLQSQKPYILSGQYQHPNIQNKINTIIFNLIPSVGEMKNLKVELSLVNDEKNWKILLSVRDEK